MTLLGWLAALVAMVTGLAMLKDTHLTATERALLREVLRTAVADFRRGGLRAIDRAELSPLVRLLLRATALLVIVGSSGVCLLPGQGVDGYAGLLLFALAAFMAMQSPCPWVRWILVGERRQDPRQANGACRRVH